MTVKPAENCQTRGPRAWIAGPWQMHVQTALPEAFESNLLEACAPLPRSCCLVILDWQLWPTSSATAYCRNWLLWDDVDHIYLFPHNGLLWTTSSSFKLSSLQLIFPQPSLLPVQYNPTYVYSVLEVTHHDPYIPRLVCSVIGGTSKYRCLSRLLAFYLPPNLVPPLGSFSSPRVYSTPGSCVYMLRFCLLKSLAPPFFVVRNPYHSPRIITVIHPRQLRVRSSQLIQNQWQNPSQW